MQGDEVIYLHKLLYMKQSIVYYFPFPGCVLLFQQKSVDIIEGPEKIVEIDEKNKNINATECHIKNGSLG